MSLSEKIETESTPTGRYQYEVIIPNDTVLKEIYEQYDIVEAKGHIYIIRDKNAESD